MFNYVLVDSNGCHRPEFGFECGNSSDDVILPFLEKLQDFSKYSLFRVYAPLIFETLPTDTLGNPQTWTVELATIDDMEEVQRLEFEKVGC